MGWHPAAVGLLADRPAPAGLPARPPGRAGRARRARRLHHRRRARAAARGLPVARSGTPPGRHRAGRRRRPRRDHAGAAAAARWLVDEEIRVRGDWTVRRPRPCTRRAGRSSSRTTTTPTSTTPPRWCWRSPARAVDPSDAACDRARAPGSWACSAATAGGAPSTPTTPDAVPRAAVLRLRRADRPAERRRHRPCRRDARRRSAGSSGRDRTAACAGCCGAQEADGSWFGRWGANYVYGTGAVVPGAGRRRRRARRPADPPGRRAGSRPPERRRRLGRGPALLRRPAGRAAGESTASQTAWALLALLAAGERSAAGPSAASASSSRPSATTAPGTSRGSPGTGFPGDFYINYHLYRLVFPVMALGRYVNGGCRRAELERAHRPPRRGARRRRRGPSSSALGRSARARRSASSPRQARPDDAPSRVVGVAGGLAPAPAHRGPRRRHRAAQHRRRRVVAASPGAPLLGRRAAPGGPRRARRARSSHRPTTCAGRDARRSPRRRRWRGRHGVGLALGMRCPTTRSPSSARSPTPPSDGPVARRRPGARRSLRSVRGPLERWAARVRASTRCCSPRPGRSAPASSGRSRSSSARSTASARPSTSAARSSTTPTSSADLEAKGAVFVEELDEVPTHAVVVLAAHGVSPAVRREAARAPDLRSSTPPARSSPRCTTRPAATPPRTTTIVLVGHADHEEVVGTVGEAPDQIHVVAGRRRRRAGSISMPTGRSRT